MATMQEIEIWVMVNEEGEYEAGACDDDAVQRFEENCTSGINRRLIKITLNVPLPETIELEGEVPDTEGKPTLKLAEAKKEGA